MLLTIVNRLCEQLKQNHLHYENAYIRRTGGIESDSDKVDRLEAVGVTTDIVPVIDAY